MQKTRHNTCTFRRILRIIIQFLCVRIVNSVYLVISGIPPATTTNYTLKSFLYKIIATIGKALDILAFVMRALVIIALFWWHFVVAALEGTSNNPASSMTGRCEHRCGNVSVTDVHIIGFFPCTDRNDMKVIPVDNCDGIERIPVMNLALEEINERSDLLPGYRIVVDYANSDVRNDCIHTVETVPHSLLTCSLVCS